MGVARLGVGDTHIHPLHLFGQGKGVGAVAVHADPDRHIDGALAHRQDIRCRFYLLAANQGVEVAALVMHFGEVAVEVETICNTLVIRKLYKGMVEPFLAAQQV